MNKNEMEAIRKMEDIFGEMTNFCGYFVEADWQRQHWDDLLAQWNDAIADLQKAMK